MRKEHVSRTHKQKTHTRMHTHMPTRHTQVCVWCVNKFHLPTFPQGSVSTHWGLRERGTLLPPWIKAVTSSCGRTSAGTDSSYIKVNHGTEAGFSRHISECNISLSASESITALSAAQREGASSPLHCEREKLGLYINHPPWIKITGIR